MKVRELMSTSPHSCRPQDTLESAARTMWEHDCGALPVVDADGRVTAAITDRDICMAAYLKGRRLSEVQVNDCMSPSAITCRPDEDVEAAAATMARHRIRRLPVVDGKGTLRGLLSLNDLARAAERDAGLQRQTLKVMAAVCQPRATAPANVMSPRAASMLAAKEMEC